MATVRSLRSPIVRLQLASGFPSSTFEDILAILLVVKMYCACRFTTNHLKVFFLEAGLLLRDFLSLMVQIFEVES